jgi:ABC-type lipoprotein release transport system permease subunit
MKIIILAWRNIWRNKKRTIITIGSIFFALILSILMAGLQKGTYNNMIKTSVEDFYGYIQVHQKGYTNKKDLSNSMEYTREIQDYLISNNNVRELHPRIESFSLSAFGNKTKGIPIVGVIPELEFEKPGLKKRLVEGEFPTTKNGGLLITERYSKFMGIELGDSIAFIGQGYHGMSAVGLYRVCGIIKLPNAKIDAGFAYMELSEAQELFNLQGRVTSIVLCLNNIDTYRETLQELEIGLPADCEILSWEQEMPEIKQMIESDAKGGVIFRIILYIVIGFGIFGTALMMVAERIKEFAIMIALGMQKLKVICIVGVEMIFIALLGIASAVLASIPIMYYLFLNPIRFTGESALTFESMGFEPIMPVAWDASYYFTQALVVIIITAIAILYPLWGIKKVKVVKALKN